VDIVALGEGKFCFNARNNGNGWCEVKTEGGVSAKQAEVKLQFASRETDFPLEIKFLGILL